MIRHDEPETETILDRGNEHRRDASRRETDSDSETERRDRDGKGRREGVKGRESERGERKPGVTVGNSRL